ncbi:ABC transporter family substrate-binding protein [Propioniciclava coleopterorum]|uniref:ABC transporter family substrate-binding protein n=1 Tax=Propioniciclava coleopterorum TaxID=2714937 RepID=UPI001980117B|nr:ABC transporter family substrate-binding protein [Propioniciclava coleopterorum]
MSKRKLLAAAGIVLSSALALSACTPPTPQATTTANTAPKSINVAWNQAFYSYNNNTDYGNATANANVIYMANDNIAYYDKDLKLAQNPSFGKMEKISDSPLKVKVTFADTASWSDGTPVDASDALLMWGSLSGHFNTKEDVEQDDEGNVGANEGSDVFFNGSSPGYGLITDFPEISDDNKSITYTWSKPYVDWEILMATPTGVPAHIVAKRALGTADAAASKKAFVEAFKNKDNAALSKISNVFNNDFNFKSMPADKELLVGSGPYTITDLKEEQYTTLEKNPNYKGSHKPSIDKVTIRITPDPQASVQALQNGEILVTQPQSTADILKQLQGMQNVSVLTQNGGTYEHVDTVFTNGGPFDPAKYGGDAEKAKKVRQAFLQTIPRQKIIDNIIKPLNPTAELRNSFTTVPDDKAAYGPITQANGMEATYGGGSNTDKAKALLAEAGVTNPTVRIMYASNNTRRQQEFQLIKEAGEAAGFKIEDVGSKDWGQLLKQPNQYDASLFGWQSTSTGVAEVAPNYLSTGQNNYGKYKNDSVDAQLNELNVTTDTAKQLEILKSVEKQLVDDAFGITIFQFPEVTGISSKIQNVSSIPLSPNYYWNFWEWKVS